MTIAIMMMIAIVILLCRSVPSSTSLYKFVRNLVKSDRSGLSLVRVLSVQRNIWRKIEKMRNIKRDCNMNKALSLPAVRYTRNWI